MTCLRRRAQARTLRRSGDAVRRADSGREWGDLNWRLERTPRLPRGRGPGAIAAQRVRAAFLAVLEGKLTEHAIERVQSRAASLSNARAHAPNSPAPSEARPKLAFSRRRAGAQSDSNARTCRGSEEGLAVLSRLLTGPAGRCHRVRDSPSTLALLAGLAAALDVGTPEQVQERDLRRTGVRGGPGMSLIKPAEYLPIVVEPHVGSLSTSIAFSPCPRRRAGGQGLSATRGALSRARDINIEMASTRFRTSRAAPCP